jgi:hypothetical protein
VFFDQHRAERTAYLGMIDHITDQSGVASALVAQALQHPSGKANSAVDDVKASSPSDTTTLYQTARDAVAVYLTKRTEATRPPSGLIDALVLTRHNLTACGDGSGESVVGVSALPPTALNGYLKKTDLRRTFDCVYSVGHPPEKTTPPATTQQHDEWIRQLPQTATWPSVAVMKAICALHQAKPKEAVLIGGNLAEEVSPAQGLGMTGIYVRLGILEATPEVEGLKPTASAGLRRPDGIVTRVQDLPQLPVFRRTVNDRASPAPRPSRPADRER